MIAHSQSVVIERARHIKGHFETEPYEVGWAGEAVVFLTVRPEAKSDDWVEARMQISPDGVQWIDEGSAFAKQVGPGVTFLKLSNFGNWLRIVGTAGGSGDGVAVSATLALKE